MSHIPYSASFIYKSSSYSFTVIFRLRDFYRNTMQKHVTGLNRLLSTKGFLQPSYANVTFFSSHPNIVRQC